MPTDFRHPKRKISRARMHIEALQHARAKFLGSRPYTCLVDTDARTGKDIYKVRITQPVPDIIYDLIDEAVGCLRSALDKACYATSRRPGSSGCQFPIADDFEALIDQIVRRKVCNNLEPQIIALLLSLEPYKRVYD